MNIHNTAIVPNQIYSAAVVTLPTMLYNTTSGFNNTITVPNNTTTTITSNYNNLTIGTNCNVTLTGNIFGKIEYDAGTSITFTQGVLDIQEIDAKMASATNKSFMRFSQDAIIRVPKTVRIQESCVVNPNQYHVVFYIGVSETGNPGELQVFPKGTTFNASAYVPNGQIHTEHDASTSLPGIMNGQFIANKFNSNGKYIFWNWKTCTPSPFNAIDPESPVTQAADQDLSIHVFPNPFNQSTAIELQLVSDEMVDVQVYNMIGEKVCDIIHKDLLKNTPYHFDIQGEILKEPGLYLVKVTIGGNDFSRRILFLK